MFNILTYVRVAPATADVHIILEVPATDKIHIEDRCRLAPGGGTLGISGWGCVAGTLEPLA